MTRTSLSRVGRIDWSELPASIPPQQDDQMKPRRWPLVAMFGTLSLSYFTMIATAAGMVSDAESHIRAENTSIGMGAFITALLLAITTTTAAVGWALSVKYEIKTLRNQLRDQGKEIDILRGVVGQDASETD